MPNKGTKEVKTEKHTRTKSPTLILPEWNMLQKKSIPRQLKKYVPTVPPPKLKN